MYLRFPIFKLLPSNSPKLYLLHFKTLFWCLLKTNFCHSKFAKLHCSHMTLDRSKILVKHEQLCLLPSFKISAHFISSSERSCYFLEVTSNWDLNTKRFTTPKSLKFWETHNIYVFYIYSKFQLYWWWPQGDITFKRNWLQNWDWNFRCLDISQYKSKWHEISLTHIFLYDL